MKMKVLIVFIVMVGLGHLNAVGINLQDGVYKVAFDQPDAFGYKGFLEITVQTGRIDSAIFDYVNSQDGSLKSEDPSYEKQMKAAAGIGPAEYTKRLVKELLALQDADVDTVAGATDSSSDLRLLAKAAIYKADHGDTHESSIPQPHPATN